MPVGFLRLVCLLGLAGAGATGPVRAAGEATLTSAELPGLLDFADPEGTRERLLAALPAVRSGGDAGVLAELLTQVARTHSRLGEFEEAHRALDEVEASLSEERPRAVIRYRLERARTWNLAEERKAEAREMFQRAFALADRTGQADLAVDAAHMIAFTAPGFDEQLEWTRRALSIAEAAPDPEARDWLGSLATNLGWTYFDHGDYAQALEAFERALEHRRREGDREAELRARWNLGRAYRALGRFDDAMALQRELLSEYEAQQLPVYGYVWEELAELLLEEGDPGACVCFRRASEALADDVWMVNSQPERLRRLEALGACSSGPAPGGTRICGP